MDKIKRVALVTGAAGGIGKETAENFLKSGMRVAIADIQNELGLACVKELSEFGECEFFHCDLTSDTQMEALVPDVVKRFGRLDVLVNNAGIPNRSPIGSVTHEEYDKMFAVHLKAAFFLSQAAAEHMKSERWGRIVNVSSPRAILPDVVHPVYGICKAAVRSMTEFFAFGLSRWNIRVNAISPAMIYTPMTEHYRHDEVSRITDSLTPSGCYQNLSSVIDVIAFLISDASASITGQTLETEAGMRYVNMFNLGQYEKMQFPKTWEE
ncbi:MAG: SDR family oxidoreductase [Oscillospiraceae bacterium]